MTPLKSMIALTGGSGFIGRRFAEVARAQGFRIRHLSRNARDIHITDEISLLDLKQGPIEPATLMGCDAVIHLAAYIPRNHTDPAEAGRCWKVNAMGTLRLAGAAVRAGIGHFVQTTSANAYAAWEKTPAETAAMFPRSRGYYLGSKIMQEVYAEAICRPAHLSLATMRLGSVYGPGQTEGAVAVLAHAIANGRPVILQDGGRFGADFVHVDDVVAALMLVIGQRAEGIFNVGSGVRTTIRKVTQTLVGLIGQNGARIQIDAKSNDGDRGFSALSIARLSALGYTPRDIFSGLASVTGEGRIM